ncbi:hypothetical protein NKG94_13460 [Micromonospora sp. M12]
MSLSAPADFSALPQVIPQDAVPVVMPAAVLLPALATSPARTTAIAASVLLILIVVSPIDVGATSRRRCR